MSNSTNQTYPQLSPRKAEIVSLVVKGLANKQIARRMGIGEKTVRNQLTSVLAQTGCQSRIELALRFRNIQDDGKRFCPMCGREFEPLG